MSQKRATIHDVAKVAHVSIKTVSRVFNNEPNVKKETKQKVLHAAQQLHYTPNVSAKRLANNRTYVVGMIYDNPNPEYVTEIQYGCLSATKPNGYNLLICPCQAHNPNLIEEVIGLHRQSTVDGFIILQPLSDHQELMDRIKQEKIPCVRVSQRNLGDAPWVSVADDEAAENMTHHLIDLGHRQIGFIMGHPEHSSSHDRLKGFRTALQKRNVPFDESYLEQGYFNYESGYAGGHRLIDHVQRPTAIFASNDQMALGVMAAAHEKGLQIPLHLSVAGFDDTSMAKHAWPPLTTIRQPIQDLAKRATEILLNQITGEESERLVSRMAASIIFRASTAPISKIYVE